MLKLTTFIALFFICSKLFAATEAQSVGHLTDDDYRAAGMFGFKSKMKLAREKRRREFDTAPITASVADEMENDRRATMLRLDIALKRLLTRADGVLRATGHDALADEIKTEYEASYVGFYSRYNEMGDYEPIAEWMVVTHEKIHAAVGDFLCKYFRFHDLFVLAYAPTVVFHPKEFPLDEFKDHLAGHMTSRWTMKHTGLAGMVTWWAVEVVCSGATSGVGIAMFVCGPISSVAELVMNNRIAPPMAERIWKRQND